MNPDEIAAVCTRLRARDREELAAYGWTPDDAQHALVRRAPRDTSG